MAKDTVGDEPRSSPWRIIGWGTAGLLLLLPWIMKAPWTGSDYVFAAVLFGSVGIASELIVRKSGSFAYRLGAAMAVIAAVLTIWINGAVGMIGSEDNPYNLVFLGVLIIALTGAVLSRFQAPGMMRATAVAAIAQLAAGAAGLPTDVRGAILSMLFASVWVLSAAFFRNAASENSNGAAH